MRRSKVMIFAAGLNCLLACGALGQQPQVLKLPPVPDRELDPELHYQRDPAAVLAAQKERVARNEKRRQLLIWATNELVAMSERAEKAASGPDSDASKAELAANVNKIEALAKNLAVAMKAQ